MLQGFDVFERAFIHGDDVCALALFDGAEVIELAQQLGGMVSRRFDGFHGRHAGFHHVLELQRILAMRKHAGVRTESDGHASLIRLREGLANDRSDGKRLFHHEWMEKARNFRRVGHRHPGDDGRYHVAAVFDHQIHGLVVHVRAVLDGRHAGANGTLHAFGAVRVRRHFAPEIAGGFHHHTDFLFRELRHLSHRRQRQHSGGGGDFDQIRAALDGQQRRPARAFHAGHHAFGFIRHRQDVLAVAVGGIGMAAEHAQRFGGDEHPRPDDVAAIHRIAQGHVDKIIGAHIAHRGESGHERAFKVFRGDQRHIGRVQLKPLDVAAFFQLPTHMHMAVDKAGHDPFLTQVNEFIRFSGFHKAAAHIADSAVFNDNGYSLPGRIRYAIDEMPGVNNGFLRPHRRGQKRQHQHRAGRTGEQRQLLHTTYSSLFSLKINQGGLYTFRNIHMPRPVGNDNPTSQCRWVVPGIRPVWVDSAAN